MIKNESGRSMVEMLGVLAIIGVLSVGGIAGYTMAMRKYRANEIVNAVSMLYVYCQTNACTNEAYTNAYAGTSLPSGASALTGTTDNNGDTTINVTIGEANLASDVIAAINGSSTFSTTSNASPVAITKKTAD